MLTNTRTSYKTIYFFVALLCLIVNSHATEEKVQTETNISTESSVEVKTSARKRRRERQNSKERQAYVTFNNMTYEQLIKRKTELVEEKNYAVAIKYLKRILTVCTDAGALAGHMLQLADLLFESEYYKKAVGVYRDFIRHYPGSSRVEYALYRAICASFKCTHSPDRDQTPTHETLELVDIFLSRTTIFSTYTQEVTQIQQECFKKLVDSDLNVCTFYRDRGQTDLMERRLAMLQEDYGNRYAETHTMILAFRNPNGVPAEPAAVTPVSDSITDATLITQAETPKQHMANRF